MKTVTKKVKIKLITPLLGTVPMNKDVYATYIETKRPKDVEGEPEEISVEEREERGWTGFHRDEKGLFVYDYFIKGFIKTAGNILKDELGVKNLRSKLNDNLFVQPRKIYLGKKKADSVVERPLRAQTPQGPRVTLVRSDCIEEGTEISFDVVILTGKGDKAEVKDTTLTELLQYGRFQGLGQFRNGGYGRFEVVSVK